MFKKELWTVRAHNGQTYEAIGYEMRGIFGVPVADCVDGEYIDCTVYEIVHGMIPPRGRSPHRADTSERHGDSFTR